MLDLIATLDLNASLDLISSWNMSSAIHIAVMLCLIWFASVFLVLLRRLFTVYMALPGYFYHKAYLVGYHQESVSRFLRRLLAGSQIHRAWLSGRLGIFYEDVTRYSVCDHAYCNPDICVR